VSFPRQAVAIARVFARDRAFESRRPGGRDEWGCRGLRPASRGARGGGVRAHSRAAV